LERIEEALFWLETYQHSIGDNAVRAFEVVDHVDNRAQSDRLLLLREYLRSGGRMQSQREQRIWQALGMRQVIGLKEHPAASIFPLALSQWAGGKARWKRTV